MEVELYPFLADMEHDLDSPWARDNNPLWGIGTDARNARINATITKFDRQLQAASSVDDLAAYAEGLIPHLQKVMEYKASDIRTDYQNTLVNCHRILSYAFFSLIVREFDRKDDRINISDYVAKVGTEGNACFFTDVSQTASNWGIFHTPTIKQLLSGELDKKRQKEYNLLVEFPNAKNYLDRLYPAFLNKDDSLKSVTNLTTAAVIAYSIAGELGIKEVCKYFERFWNLREGQKLSDAKRRAQKRENKEKTRQVLQMIFRKKLPDIEAEIEDTEKVNKYFRLF